MIVIGNNNELLETFFNSLSKKFSLRNLRRLSYFLGIKLQPHADGMIMSQQKYIKDILEKINMASSKEASTAITTSSSFSLNDGSTSLKGDDFQNLIGLLQYLTITCPDIRYVVNQLSQFIHKSTTQHLIMLKCVLSYLKGTLNPSINVYQDKGLQLFMYIEPDYVDR